MKKLLAIFLSAVAIFATLGAVDSLAAAYPSVLVGSSPSNGYVLQTNGSASQWVATSSLGITGSTGTVSSISAGTGITITPNPLTTTGTIQLNTSTVNALITAYGYITSAPATTTIATGGSTATGNAFTFATTTASGKYNIVCSGSTCTFTIPPASDYLASNTTYVASFNTRTGVVTLSSADVTTALGFTPYNATNPSGYISTSTNLTTANFASPNISQWTNNVPYLTSSTGVTSYNGSVGAVTGVSSFNGATGTVTYSPSTTIPVNYVTSINGTGGVYNIYGVSPIVITTGTASTSASCPTCIATNTGNWAGTFQGNNANNWLASNTVYIATNTGNWAGT